MLPRQQSPHRATLYASCRNPLARAQAYTIAMDHSKLVIVQRYGYRPEADLAVATLDEAGIKAMVQSDSVGGMRDHLAWSGGGFKVLVREEDSSAAAEILSTPAATDNSDSPAPDDPAGSASHRST